MIPAQSDLDLKKKISTLATLTQSLDWSAAEAKNLFADVSALAASAIETRDSAPAFIKATESSPQTDFTATIGRQAAVAELASLIASSGLDTTSPRFMGYIPGGGLPTATAAAFVTTLLNRYVGMYGAAPAAAQIENDALAWLIATFGLPSTAWGTFTSGGSIATITAFMAARDKFLAAKKSYPVCYMSDQAHFANQRALHVLGLPAECLSLVPMDDNQRMDVKALALAIAKDRAQGKTPWMVAASAGTTNTGAVDALDGIAALCKKEQIWFHIDAAYGGFFKMVTSKASQLGGLSKADSLVVDPHKGMFLPYGCGAVLVAEGEYLRRSLKGGGSYLADVETSEHQSANDYSMELTRPSRGAQVWAVLKAHGGEMIAQALEEKLLLAQYFHERMRASPRFETLKNCDLSVVTFRLPGADVDTQNLLSRLTNDGRYLLSSTVLNGKLYLRCCVLCFRTHLPDVEGLLLQLLTKDS